jgi:Flp pilus assembly protein TadG
MRDVMRGVRGAACPVRRPAGGAERGAIGVLVAVLIGGGVLFGMAALVVDVGQLYQERAELQNGADAAALAVAKSCATGNCTPSLAAQYANLNASKLTGGTAAVNLVCGTGSGLAPCTTPSTGQMFDCPAAPAAGAGFVDVHTSTQLPGGSTLLPPIFARTLTGMGNYQGSTVYACAQAAWGSPSGANVVAFTISACDWDQATNLGTTFAPPPPYPPNPSISYDQVLNLNNLGNSAGCPQYGEPSGADGAGAFGWTNDPTGTCSLTLPGSFSSPGVSASQACKTALAADWANRTLVLVPVYTSVSGTGNNALYTLKGFAAFVVTGYQLSGFDEPDWLNSANNCKDSNGKAKCIEGYFTQALIPSATGVGGGGYPYLGAAVVGLTG